MQAEQYPVVPNNLRNTSAGDLHRAAEKTRPTCIRHRKTNTERQTDHIYHKVKAYAGQNPTSGSSTSLKTEEGRKVTLISFVMMQCQNYNLRFAISV